MGHPPYREIRYYPSRMKLGTLLLRNAAVTLSQLEAALKNQVLYGGRLGTNLVELGFVDLDTLSRHLADIHGVAPATQEMFEATDESVVESFGAARAERFSAFPLGPPDDQPETLQVAVRDPSDRALIDELARDSGRDIAPVVAPELRLYYYMEKHYGITRKARYVRMGKDAPAHNDSPERRKTQPARGIEMPPAMRLEPKRDDPDKASEASAPHTAASGYSLSYREACASIDMAEDREAIGDALVAFAASRFEAALVFLIRDANANGWRMYTKDRGRTDEAAQDLSLPLGGASALQQAYDNAAPYRGGPTSAGKPIERRLWELIGSASEPDEMLIVPVVVKRRVVNLIYGHSAGGRAIDDTSVKKLGELAKRAARAYMRLMRAAKKPARNN